MVLDHVVRQSRFVVRADNSHALSRYVLLIQDIVKLVLHQCFLGVITKTPQNDLLGELVGETEDIVEASRTRRRRSKSRTVHLGLEPMFAPMSSWGIGHCCRNMVL